MKTTRSLIGRVAIWGFLGVGAYTVVNMLIPYFSSMPQIPKSIQNKVKIIKKSVNDTSKKASEKIKEVYENAEKRIVNDVREKEKLQEAEKKIEKVPEIYNKKSTPLKRLGNIANKYIDDETVDQSTKESSSENDNSAGNNRDQHTEIRDEEEKIFARQLTVIDELLE